MLIGFCGAAYAGKSSSAKYFINKYNFTQLAFASALKENIGKNIFGLSDEQLYGTKKEEVDERWGLSARQILQQSGNEMRKIHNEIWVKTLINTAKQQGNAANIVVDDVRYPNEINAIKDAGGVVIKVVRPEHKQLGASESKHESETALNGLEDTAFFKVISATNLEELNEQLETLALQLELA